MSSSHSTEDSPSIKNLLKLAIPIALGMASLSVLSLVETMILGHYDQYALAASASANYVFFVFLSAFAGFAIAIQSQVARHNDGNPALAKRFTLVGLSQLVMIALAFIAFVQLFNHEIITAQVDDPHLITQAKDYLWLKSWSLLPIAILMALRGFWHGANRPKVFLSCLLLSHIAAGVLCYLLVYGKLGFNEYGLQGAAIATVISMSVGTGLLFLLSCKPLKLFTLKAAQQRFTLNEFKQGWHLAWPTSFQQVIFAVGTAVFMAVIAKTGVTELAAAHLLITLSLVLILPVIGFGMAATTFISNAFGQSQVINQNTHSTSTHLTNNQQCHQWYTLTLKLSLICVACFGAVLILATETVLLTLTDNQDVIDTAYWPLIILAPSLVFEAFTIATKQSLYAIHQNKAVLKVLGITQWLILLPAMILVYALDLGSLEVYTLMHAIQRAINGAWLYRIWKREHKKPIAPHSDIEVMV